MPMNELSHVPQLYDVSVPIAAEPALPRKAHGCSAMNAQRRMSPNVALTISLWAD